MKIAYLGLRRALRSQDRIIDEAIRRVLGVPEKNVKQSGPPHSRGSADRSDRKEV
jgi:hypothetical protein